MQMATSDLVGDESPEWKTLISVADSIPFEHKDKFYEAVISIARQ